MMMKTVKCTKVVHISREKTLGTFYRLTLNIWTVIWFFSLLFIHLPKFYSGFPEPSGFCTAAGAVARPVLDTCTSKWAIAKNCIRFFFRVPALVRLYLREVWERLQGLCHWAQGPKHERRGRLIFASQLTSKNKHVNPPTPSPDV